MRILTKAEIVQASDLKTETVEVPEWSKPGEEPAGVIVRQLSLGQLDLLRSGVLSGTTSQLVAASELLAASLIDNQGERLFNDAELQFFIQKNPAVVQRIAAVCARLNGLNIEAVDNAEKN